MTQYLLNQRDFSKLDTSKYKTSTSKCVGIYQSLHEAQQAQESIIFDFLKKKYGEDAFEQKMVSVADEQKDQNFEYIYDASCPKKTWILPIHTTVSDHGPSSGQWNNLPLDMHFIVRKSSTPLKLALRYKRYIGAWIGCGWAVEDVMELEIVELDLTKIPTIEDRSDIVWEEYPQYCEILEKKTAGDIVDFLRVAECDNTINALKEYFAPPKEEES